jgi:hypothetical protein
MRRFLIGILATVGWLLASSVSYAQNPTVPTAPCGTSTNQAASTAFVGICGGTVLTEAMLALTPTASFPNGVTRLDYSAGLGAPPQFYQPLVGTCSANGLVSDGGSCVNTTVGDGNSWAAKFSATGADAREWGISPSATDNAANLQAGINWAALAHSKLLILPQSTPYKLATQVTIGNGTSTTESTENGFSILGQPSGIGLDEGNPANAPMMFKWTGSSGVIPFVVNGPIWRVTVSGISLDCNSLCATGFEFIHPIFSHFDNLLVRNWTSGQAYVLTAYGHSVSGLAIGANNNTFNNDEAVDPVAGQGGGGLSIGQSSAIGGDLDPSVNQFDNDLFTYDATESGSCGIILRFTDSDQFFGGNVVPVFYPNPSPVGTALCVEPPTGLLQFPSNIAFYNNELSGPVTYGAGWVPEYGVSFWPWIQADFAVLPNLTLPSFGAWLGVSSAGQQFGVENGAVLSGNGGPNTLTLSSTTNYVGQGCSSTASGYICGIALPYAGQLRSISGGLSQPPGAGNTVTFQLYVNNSPVSGFDCTVTGGTATTCGPISVTQAVSSEEYMAVAVSGTSGATAAVPTWTVLYDHN